MDTIGARIKAMRKEKGLTMKQLHDLTGLSTGNISDMEHDRYAPSVAALIPLKKALGCSIDWLLSGEALIAPISEHSEAHDDPTLDNDERDLLAMYRLLPDHKKEDVFDIIHTLYQKHVERKKESIYWTYFEEDSDAKSDPAGGREARGGTA